MKGDGFADAIAVMVTLLAYTLAGTSLVIPVAPGGIGVAAYRWGWVSESSRAKK